MNYYDWQLKNKYYGKYFSIMGDSISTLKGYNPDGYNVFYDDEHCWNADIEDMSDTWWGRVIEFFGGELLVNNSWSGSKVTKLPQRNTLFPCGCSEERTSNLHKDTQNPDVIIVYLGTNDWAFGAKIENVVRNVSEKEKCESFSYAYERMLKKLKNNYPLSEIWCCTLSETKILKNSNFRFPHKHGGIHIEQYNEIIRIVCRNCNCKLIDLYEYRLPYDSMDGSHPTKDGMRTLATIIIREMGGEEINRFLDCKSALHEYAFVEANTGWNRYVCTKCGKIYDTDIIFHHEEKNNNLEYVFSDAMETTEILYPDTIKLTMINTNKKVQLQKKKVIVGCDKWCDLVIENFHTGIDVFYTIFFYENQKWFIQNNNSEQGIWLNGIKLEQGKNYQLIKNDVIDFAHIEKVIFYKTDEEYSILNEKMTEMGFKIGSIIGEKYKILKLLWKNGMSELYLVKEIHLGVFWTMKIYDKTSQTPLLFFDELIKYTEVMKKFRHSSIQKVEEAIITQKFVIIIQEYIEGMTLSDVIRKNGVQDIKNVIECAKQLCDVLQYLHTYDPPYIHCDVKPANIILMPNGKLKLIDFWNMREIHSKENENLKMGTKGYAPPEQYTGKNFDARTDIFALGMTMYYLLTGAEPAGLSYPIISIREWNPELPKKLERIICKCTEVNPKDRYQSCEELLKELNKIRIKDKKNTQKFFEELFHKS